MTIGPNASVNFLYNVCNKASSNFFYRIVLHDKIVLTLNLTIFNLTTFEK